MSTMQHTSRPTAVAAPLAGRDAGRDAFTMLRIAFAVAPIAFGLDKFFNVLVHWPKYLAPWVNTIMPGTGQQFMYVVGAVEIIAGIAVLVKPRYGAYIVALWLAGIIVNLAVVAIAALSLILDFEQIETGAEMGAPKYMEWYGAFGLLVTMVWLYVEILKLLSRFANNKN